MSGTQSSVRGAGFLAHALKNGGTATPPALTVTASSTGAWSSFLRLDLERDALTRAGGGNWEAMACLTAAVAESDQGPEGATRSCAVTGKSVTVPWTDMSAPPPAGESARTAETAATAAADT